jgi:two-component system phosphate regulon sensor histidine kinase PhoR
VTAAGDADLARDYDELASLLDAVRAEAERYRSLFESAPSALLVTDRNLKITEANAAAEALLDVPLRFLVGKPLPTFVEPSERRRFRSWELDLGHANRSAALGVRMHRRTGVPFDAAVRADVGPHEIHWSIVDRTNEAMAETRLWELNRELDRRVREQSAEVETLVSQLPVAVMIVRAGGEIAWENDRARTLFGDRRAAFEEGHPARRALAGETVRSERVRLSGERVLEITAAPVFSARGGAVVVVATDATERDRVEQADLEFVQNAAHQLRTPITGIASSAAALEAGARDDPAERDRFLTHIVRETERMGVLVEALLSLASLHRGNGHAVTELVPIRGLLDDVLASCRIDDASIECAPELAAVGDRELLGQALANVLSNAAEHGAGAGIRVRAVRERGSILLDVTDFGPGIAPEQRERIFERFYRGDLRLRGGSGLGLAIARAAAEAAHGTLELLPQRDGEGASFRFTLPGARLL